MRMHPTKFLIPMAVAAALCACSESDRVTDPDGTGTPSPVDVAFIVDSVRTAFDLPALAGAIVTVEDPAYGRAVSGTRRAAGGPAATVHDLWHLGSNFKAFTGMLAAIAVDSGAINWSTTVADAFPELAGSMRAEYETITLHNLLSHQSRLPRDPAAGTVGGSTRSAQRASVAAWAVTQPPASGPGAYNYTNTGYIVAGAMLERALGMPFEEAVDTYVFTPLGIGDAGWGPQAEAGSTQQPVAHVLVNGQWQAREAFDNLPVYASAGGAHMSVDGWSRFLQEVLRLEMGSPTIVSTANGSETTASITAISPQASYGLGWVITSRGWANGRTLTHDGSNTANYSVVWMAPNRGFAVLGLTNSYDSSASARVTAAVDALVARLISFYGSDG